ncbi:MAG TPA: protein-glutamate O-methyltransferase CheR [Spirochaetota bacterium]|nr:protein-glutamate O-methyltransferase CheR [Spirochaetota bacterium]HPF06013.1 protein-glutamate O-methyltransferase CheR [Spirochaetota bacterium]HPJ41837.1 protein-glutamate O-methyltransferase CheR [Spirochaetota bacterium]HPR36804.1 protein-glutamate O-methyltransferase CheR [Spirochaetota bacterium]HRX46343.1 protein-glutamate O-methyltransferase CheR [Spirochaetota bacterium]
MELNIKRLTDEEFSKFAKLIYDESGIYMKDSKITLLSNRLRKRLAALSLSEFSDYYNYLEKLTGDAKKKEYEELLDVVSTNETYFFRNERHFEALTDYCLPELAKIKKDRKLKIWSAACSTGEEPYTIAICVMEQMKLFHGWDIEIIATDIAPSVLEFAREGYYSGRRIEKVPPELLKKHFTLEDKEKGVYKINDDLKKMVNFYYLNFFKNPFPKNIDIIFCRNVMIYFDKVHQKELVANFYQSIYEQGYLFIGHSETLHSISEDFIYKKILEAPIYVPRPRS